MNTGRYLSLWTKYLPIIRIQIKKSFEKEVSLKLNSSEFKAVGDRKLSGYTFNLEIEHGKVANDISGTAVARDLYEVLSNDQIIVEFIKDKRIKLNMDKSFTLKFRSEFLI